MGTPSSKIQRVAFLSGLSGLTLYTAITGFDVATQHQRLSSEQRRIHSLKHDIDHNGTDIRSAQSVLVALENRLRDSETEVKQVQSALVKAEAKVRELREKKSILLDEGETLAQEIQGHTSRLQDLVQRKETKEKELVLLVESEQQVMMALERAKQNWFVTRYT
jgi:chromosome segregation ATPase